MSVIRFSATRAVVDVMAEKASMIECDIARTSGRWTSCYDLTADWEGTWQGPACAERPFGREAKGFAGGKPGRNPWVLLGRDGGKEARAGELMAALLRGTSPCTHVVSLGSGVTSRRVARARSLARAQLWRPNQRAPGARDDAVVKVRRCVGHGFELDDVG